MSSTDRKRYQHLRGTAAEWAVSNPTLAAGEIGLEVDTFKFKFGDGETAWNALPYATAAPAPSDMMPTGSIIAFAGSTVPYGFVLCDGHAIPRAGYADLFAVIGTAWGAGDGSTTFNLPDLAGAFLRGCGTGSINGRDKVGPGIGEFQEDQMQGHRHRNRGTNNNTTGASATDFANRSFVSGNASNVGAHSDAIWTDGTNGQPRTGTETRPYAAGVHYIIKT